MKIAAFDIETRGSNPEFLCGAIVSDETTDWFDDPQAMLNAMRLLARKGYTFLAHNAEYDASILFWKQGEDFAIRYLNGAYSCGWWRYGKGKKTAAIWDSFRLAAGMSLQELGASIGIEKYAIPHKLRDSEDLRQDWMCPTHERPGCIQCYNERDAEIVWGYINMLREWLSHWQIDLKRSLPSMAVAMWQSLDPNMQQSPKSRLVRDLARKAYHSGRCEVFRYGSVGPVFTHDIRSHYGYILSDISLPDIGSLRVLGGSAGNKLPQDGEGIVEADVWIEPQGAPPLPVAFGGRTYFPVGYVSGAWPLSELRDACRRGVDVRRVQAAIVTPNTTRPFANTALGMLELREDLRRRDDPRAILPKFILNSLIGRLGLREEHEIVTYRRWHAKMSMEYANGAELESAGGALYLAKRHTFARPSPTGNIVWASCITGAGRIRLNRHIQESGDGIVYCDTDSIHCLSPLIVGTDGPGQLVSTGSWDESLYLGPKLYQLQAYTGESEVRAKGIPRKMAADFIANGRTNYQTSLHVIEAISKGVEPSTWVDVERIGRGSLAGRTMLNPTVLRTTDSYSLTTPVVFELGSDGRSRPMTELTLET